MLKTARHGSRYVRGHARHRQVGQSTCSPAVTGWPDGLGSASACGPECRSVPSPRLVASVVERIRALALALRLVPHIRGSSR
ncbi:hypothetical protein NFA_32560 [Nocardia farcinica IFM 10152]|uniref:Uncharacterized protein n=1 Tax=Nocardia farcinica (strain IFM 10152) TaxID=247156 RepID=Q5YUN8_NOCFA|nr:hypothetical protein NFA_32560 [Nocardia farcinica IFM 10152]